MRTPTMNLELRCTDTGTKYNVDLNFNDEMTTIVYDDNNDTATAVSLRDDCALFITTVDKQNNVRNIYIDADAAEHLAMYFSIVNSKKVMQNKTRLHSPKKFRKLK